MHVIDCLQYCNWSEKIFRQMRESCDYLTNFICAQNTGIKRAPSMQVAKSRLNLDAVLLQRLDLANSLRGDEQVA